MTPELQLGLNIALALFVALIGYTVKQRDRKLDRLEQQLQSQKDKAHETELELTRVAGVVLGLERAQRDTITKAEWKQWSASVERTLDELRDAVQALLTGRRPYRRRADTLPGAGETDPPSSE